MIRLFFLLMGRQPPRSALFPCTTLYRSLLVKPLRSGTLRAALPVSTSYTAATVDLGTVTVHPATTELTASVDRSEEHTSELQSRQYLVCRLLLDKKNNMIDPDMRFPLHS